jgi:glutaredoxin
VSQLVYVTTDDCHFCEHGRDILDELGVERREIADSSEEAAVLAERGLRPPSCPSSWTVSG